MMTLSLEYVISIFYNFNNFKTKHDAYITQ